MVQAIRRQGLGPSVSVQTLESVIKVIQSRLLKIKEGADKILSTCYLSNAISTCSQSITYLISPVTYYLPTSYLPISTCSQSITYLMLPLPAIYLMLMLQDSASFAGGQLLEAGADSAALIKRILDRRQRSLEFGQESSTRPGKHGASSARCRRFKARYRQLHRAATDGNEGGWSLLASWLRSEMLWLDSPSGADAGLRDIVREVMPSPDSGKRWGQLQLTVLRDEDGDYEPEDDLQVDQAVIYCLRTHGEGKGMMFLQSYRIRMDLEAGRSFSILGKNYTHDVKYIHKNYTHVKYIHKGPGETLIARLEQVPIHECSTCGIVPTSSASPAALEDTLAELAIDGDQAGPSSYDPDIAPASCNKLLKCQRCDAARYCSKACQKADWPAHKLECKILANLSESEEPPRC